MHTTCSHVVAFPPVRPGQGLTQVIEKAETSLGIPSPTELSVQVEQEQKEQGEWGLQQPAYHFSILFKPCVTACLVFDLLQVKAAVTQIKRPQMDRQRWEARWECWRRSPVSSRAQWAEIPWWFIFLSLSCSVWLNSELSHTSCQEHSLWLVDRLSQINPFTECQYRQQTTAFRAHGVTHVVDVCVITLFARRGRQKLHTAGLNETYCQCGRTTPSVALMLVRHLSFQWVCFLRGKRW